MPDRSISVRYGANIDGYLAGIARMKTATTDFARHASKSITRSKDDWDKVGGAMLKAGGAVVAGLGVAGKAAIDWESAWTGVMKTVDASPAQFAALEKGLRDMAKTLPATHEEIAAVAEAAGQLGVRTEDILGFTRTMIDLGETTNLTADEAATAIAQISNVMGTMERDGAEGVERFGSALVELGNNGASTEREIVMMAQRIAGAAKVVGMSEADLLSLSNALASVGIRADEGGSAISRVLMDLSKAVKQGGEDLDGFARVAGMSAEQFSTAFEESPTRAMAAFTNGLGRIKDAGGDVFTTLDELGQSDVRTSRALLNMAGAGDLLTQSLDDGSRAWEENTALADEAEKRYATNASKIQTSWNKVKDAAIDFGGAVAPAIASGAEALAGIATTFAELPKPVRDASVAIGMAGGAVLLLGGGAIKATLAVLRMRDAMVAAGLTSGRFGATLGRLGRTMGLITFAAVASEARDWIQTSKIADVETQKLADSMKSLGSEEVTGGLFDLFRNEGGWFGLGREDVLSTTEAVERFQGAARGAFKDWNDGLSGFDAQMGRWQNGTAVFDEYVTSLDAALAQMVADGNIEEAQKAFNALFDGMDPSVVDETKAAFTQYGGALEEQQATAAETAKVNKELGLTLNETTGEWEDASKAAEDAARKAEEAKQAYEDVQNAILMMGGGVRAEAAANRNFRDALKEANEAAGDSKTTLDERRAALESVAEASLQVVTKQMDMGRGADEITATMQQQRDAFIEVATKALGSADAATELADAMGLIPDAVRPQVEAVGVKESTAEVLDLKDSIFRLDGKVVTVKEEGAKPSKGRVLELDGSIFGLKDKTVKVEEIGATASGERVVRFQDKIYALEGKEVPIGLNTGPAANSIIAIQRKIDGIRGKTVYVNVVERQIGSAGGWSTRGGQVRGIATGGPVWGPGTGTSDSIPAWLSNGEYVIKAAAVARYGIRLFHDLNAMRLASGGPVTRTPRSTTPQPPAPIIIRQDGASQHTESYSQPRVEITVNNRYPQEEPTSVTVRRAMDHASALGMLG